MRTYRAPKSAFDGTGHQERRGLLVGYQSLIHSRRVGEVVAEIGVSAIGLSETVWLNGNSVICGHFDNVCKQRGFLEAIR
jgi:hypothetical protein